MTRTAGLSGARRGGFTLVELLVAAALCVVIMTVLAVAFRSGMDTLSQVKSVADMTDRLRAVEVVMQNDLKADHLEDEYGTSVRVSDRLVNRQWDGVNRRWDAATQKRGFFRIVQGSAPKTAPGAGACPIAGLAAGAATDPYLWEGYANPDPVHTFRAHDHWIHFTTKLSGQTDRDVYTVTDASLAAVAADLNLRTGLTPANSLTSRWAEVAYFLDPTPTDQFTVGANSFPLYTLCRRQRVIAQTAPAGAVLAPGLAGVSVLNVAGNLNTPLTITTLANRLFGAGPPAKLTGANLGNDVLLTNVVSFQVQVMTDNSSEYRDLYDIGVLGPTGDTEAWPRSWDTATQPALVGGIPYRVRGVRITVRVYDVRNAKTRQMTFQQDL